jgi:hypothetical protein
MNYYEFVSIWNFDAPIESAWDEIEHSENWHEWWKGVLEVEELKTGDENGIGKIVRSTWKSVLPYKLIFDSEIIRVENLKLIEARAFGELEGVGIWQFFAESSNKARVRYDWKVRTTKSWMNFFAPLAKPFFKFQMESRHYYELGRRRFAGKIGETTVVKNRKFTAVVSLPDSLCSKLRRSNTSSSRCVCRRRFVQISLRPSEISSILIPNRVCLHRARFPVLFCRRGAVRDWKS